MMATAYSTYETRVAARIAELDEVTRTRSSSFKRAFNFVRKSTMNDYLLEAEVAEQLWEEFLLRSAYFSKYRQSFYPKTSVGVVAGEELAQVASKEASAPGLKTLADRIRSALGFVDDAAIRRQGITQASC